ncbi:MAG: GMC family oxidoreductase, partial [Anaerolineales bacterium]|nr:GMC family oxidoreductase [Anaerolineales bacterium]
EVVDVRPLTADSGRQNTVDGQPSTVKYEVTYQKSTSLFKNKQTVRANNVIFSAGVMGTMKLLLNLRDVKKSLPNLSGRLGTMVRTNSEGLLGSVARKSDINYSEGVSISSIYNFDEMTRIEPVRRS